MKTLVSAAFVIATLATTGCNSTSGGSSSGNGSGGVVAQTSGNAAGGETAAAPMIDHPIFDAPRTQSARRNTAQPVARNQPTAQAKAAPPSNPLPKSPDVSILKLDAAEVPTAVRAIERVIDRKSALLADNVLIEVSKNYEWDLGLSGDSVTPQKPDRGGTISESTGNPRCTFRNLDVRARDKITVWRSGLGVTPFIRVHATGAISYIDTDDSTGKPRVKRSGTCRINNANIAFDDQILGIPTAEELLSARPAGQSGKK